ncbi:MAG TPA: alpha/beta hydrolase [Chryseolinea sp.]|nr:alpha/beta hydrolase [Chryseolinea sp.]
MILIGLLCALTVCAQDKRTTDQLVSELGKGFVSNTAKVNGTTLHYVRGGNGPAIILLHGFPYDWYAYHKIMPLLAKKFTVVAVDLRGIGGSSATRGGYESPNMAEDIRQLTQQLKLEQTYVVGHDIGGMVAYAFAQLYPQAIRGAMILDVPLPGIEPWEECVAGPEFWHIPFHQTPDLPEHLLAGRQAVYFRSMLHSDQFSDSDVSHFAASYGEPDHLRAGLELYRAFPANARFNSSQRTAIDVPLVWAGGEKSFFAKIGLRLARDLKEHGCRNVKTEIIQDSAHEVMIDQPEIVAELIEQYASL